MIRNIWVFELTKRFAHENEILGILLMRQSVEI